MRAADPAKGYRCGRSTASTKSRVSLPLRPGSPGLPRQSGSIFAHWASVKTNRSIHSLNHNQAPIRILYSNSPWSTISIGAFKCTGGLLRRPAVRRHAGFDEPQDRLLTTMQLWKLPPHAQNRAALPAICNQRAIQIDIFAYIEGF